MLLALNFQRKILHFLTYLSTLKQFNSHKQKQSAAYSRLSGRGKLFKLHKDSARQREYFGDELYNTGAIVYRKVFSSSNQACTVMDAYIHSIP